MRRYTAIGHSHTAGLWPVTKLELLNIRMFRYKVYVYINKILRLAKVVLHVAISYLVGYKVYNI
jgi:hypothetical protein